MKQCLAALAFLAVVAVDASADSIPPLGPGPNPVGCSNVAQDFTRVPVGDSAQDYWEGNPAGNTQRYITDLLADPANTVTVNLAVPNDGGLYGPYAARSFPYVMLVCYPTSFANLRPDYPLPTGDVVPHMQRGGEAPILADASARYPILLFSHGLTGSPLSGDYINAVRLFASWGYVVVAPFHGDLRFANVKLDSFSDYFYALVNIKAFVAMQAVRPLSLSLGLDSVLAGTQFAGHVDAAKVGGFGASLGGESLLLMAGAQLTTTVGQSYKQVTFDPRLKAAAGYVPYFGQLVFPAFGRDQNGLQGITLPFLAISGTADTTAPIAATERGFEFLHNTRQLVALTGVEHGFNPAFSDEIFTWSLAFLSGQLSGDAVARATSARMTSVAGGGEDVLKTDYMAPSPALAGERIVVEFRNDSLNHYFITAEPAESALLDAGNVIPGWQRTGFDFKEWAAGDPRGLPACRFFGTPGIGPNSHFYTISAYECGLTKANPYWLYEGIAFNSDAPTGEICAADRVPVVRLYNNGMGGQASHRFVTSHSEVRETVQRGWMVEGVVFCAIP
jgi:predicted dienelactone hydrolase